MLRFLVRRLLFAIFLVVAVSSGALFLTRLAPGDVTAQLGLFASQAEIASTRARYDLDRGPVSQWALWVARASRFDFVNSFLYNRPVRELIGRAAANTAALALVALTVSTLVGIPLGVFTGSRKGVAAALVRGVSLVCVSAPPLITSLLLVFIATRTRWFPVGGMTSVNALDMQWSAWVADVALHLPLPAQSMSDALHQPFLLAAVARGVSPRDLIVKHAWRVSLRPICAVYGLVIGALLSGSFVVEYVTAWPGLGRLMFEALRARDIYLVAGCAAMGGLFLACGSLIGGLLLAAADPRAREAQTT